MNDASTTLRQRKYSVDRGGKLTEVSIEELTAEERTAIAQARWQGRPVRRCGATLQHCNEEVA